MLEIYKITNKPKFINVLLTKRSLVDDYSNKNIRDRKSVMRLKYSIKYGFDLLI